MPCGLISYEINYYTELEMTKLRAEVDKSYYKWIDEIEQLENQL